MFEVTTRVEVKKCDIGVWITDCLSFYTIAIYLKKNIFILKTEVYYVPECILSTVLGIFLHWRWCLCNIKKM